VRLLLDTHIALWAIADDPRLPVDARSLITDNDNSVTISAASIWEIAIKHALRRRGPSSMPLSGSEALGYFRAAGYEFLAVTPAHAAAVDRLPPHHADPFDRILAAQAILEPMRLITHDLRLARYTKTIILV
jgi:PIN domain nuclease of toxin-antitoxin system